MPTQNPKARDKPFYQSVTYYNRFSAGTMSESHSITRTFSYFTHALESLKGDATADRIEIRYIDESHGIDRVVVRLDPTGESLK